jgi:hypothetical protein
MNNYVYYDILLAKKRCERSALVVEPRTSLELQQFPDSLHGGLFAPRACFRGGVVNGARLGGTSPKGYNREI